MGVVVKYVLQLGGRYIYRRAVPERLREALGKREIKIPLGKSQAEMMRKYGSAHTEVEKLFKRTRLSSSQAGQADPANKSPLELYNDAIDEITALRWKEDIAKADDIEIEHRDITAELELEKYRRGEDGEYLNVPPDKKAFIYALRSREAPEPTLLDAKSVYMQDKITGDLREKEKLQRLERAMKPLVEVAGKNPPLNQITRRHAKNVNRHANLTPYRRPILTPIFAISTWPARRCPGLQRVGQVRVMSFFDFSFESGF